MLLSLLGASAFACPVALQAQPTSGQFDNDVARRRVEFSALDSHAFDVRTVRADGTVERFAIDAAGNRQTGAWLDSQRRANHDLQHARRERLAPSLAAYLSQRSATEQVEVAFWLLDDFTAESPSRAIHARACDVEAAAVPESVRSARLDILEQAIAAHAPRQRAFAERVANAGGEVVSDTGGVPLIIARVPAGRVAELALAPEVDEAYRSMPTWATEGDDAQQTLRTLTVKNQNVSAESSSVRFLVNDTTEVVIDNPSLPPINYLFGPGFNSSHATAVAGNVANHHPLYEAAASGIPELWSSDGTGDIDAPNVWMTAVTAGIDFGNCSWWNFLKGDIEFLDRFFDYTIRNFGMMMFKSNGNQGNTSEPYGTTPGQGYNVTCSGNYSDADNGFWDDDAMASSSSYWNPVTGHHKPEVASPGSGVTTTGVSSELYFGFGGTSSASPLTAGVATLLASGDPSLLAEMTSVKAVLMASAWHNVEGEALLSDKDGAGGVHAAAAWATVRDGQRWFADVTDTSFNNDTLTIPMDLVVGDETRVVALWFSNPNSSYSTDVLEMDLDMTVIGPGGGVVATSASTANPFEIASFIPPQSGTYEVVLTRQRFDGVSEPLSVVWSSQSDANTAELALPNGTSASIGSTVAFQVSETYEGANSAYGVTLAEVGAPQIPLPKGFALPTGYDATTDAFLALPGALGVLDNSGQATFSTTVPNSAGFVGLSFSVGATVFIDSLINLNSVRTTSDATTLSITN